MSSGFRGITGPLPHYSTDRLTTAPLRSGRSVLKVENGFLSEIDEKLPLGRHVRRVIQQIDAVKHFVMVVPVRTQEVVVGDPEGEIVVGAVKVVKAVGRPVGGLVGTVEAFYHLLVGPELSRDGIVVCKADDLSDVKPEGIAKASEELLSSQRVDRIAIGNEAELFRKFLKVPESHAHGHDAGTDGTVVGDAVTDDGTAESVHDEPDEGFNALDFNVGLVSGKGITGMVIEVVHERLDADGGGFAVVGDLLMGNGDPVKIMKSESGLTEGQPKVHMKRKTKGHDVSIVFTESEGRGVFRKRVELHPEEIHQELAVDVVELILVLSEILVQVRFIHLLQVVKVVGAFGIHALVDHEEPAVFLLHKGTATVRTAEVEGRESVSFIGRESGITDFTQKLTFGTVIPVKVDGRSQTSGAGAGLRNTGV